MTENNNNSETLKTEKPHYTKSGYTLAYKGRYYQFPTEEECEGFIREVTGNDR